MPLKSKLFRDEKALQAAAIEDSAHIVPGASGPHVGKIQRALAILDGAIVDGTEVKRTVYGRSTAAAVLAYKTARRIVNASYQRQADDIVGRMTIAALDAGMLEAEQRPAPTCCCDPVRGGTGFDVARSRGFSASLVGDPSTPQLPGVLSILVQIVRVNGDVPARAFDLQSDTWKRANELAGPFGLRVAKINGFSFSFPLKVNIREAADFEGLRKAAEKAMPGFKQALRVLITQFAVNAAGDDDTKTNGVSFDVEGFDRFIVLNANAIRADRGTLLHEMIHCSRPELMSDASHDRDDDASIFSWGSSRSRLKPVHARLLQQSFFGFAR